jgi:hypothetical protein
LACTINRQSKVSGNKLIAMMVICGWMNLTEERNGTMAEMKRIGVFVKAVTVCPSFGPQNSFYIQQQY